ncbi:MAG: DUF2752 domain-containing protein [Kiritimatiellia bacterium]|nr:DUF2752 domain-containing protein [Kiritimatiellia bacterium]MDP6631167.1 DUF2752 domain-containing protein [Kiritimatiellia bacterium]MDP6809811.1 DUF2752 domain-containing protein [Kiritimatiellia bacterium]MDP7025079.1 DUF2752 domain-containing protein [Kiritimatiellia bacterium]
MVQKAGYTVTQWVVHIGGALSLPVALLFGRLFARHVNDAPIICLWRRVVGWHCPGCGMTRALCLFATGQFSASIRTHWLIVPVIAVAMAVFFKSLIWIFRSCNGKGRC